MKWQTIFKYALIFSGSMLIQPVQQNTNSDKEKIKPSRTTVATEHILPENNTQQYDILKYNQAFQLNFIPQQIEEKANALRDTYIDNMLNAQKKLAPLMGTRMYYSAVKRELPGAPVGLHCVFGQYTQLSKAQKALGDTITIVPKDASNACFQFKYQMRKKYNAPEYDNCIFEGKIYKNDSLYNSAMANYIQRRLDKDKTNAEKLKNDFSKQNFSVSAIEPGTMMVVPRHRGSKHTFHMIMFLGRGRIENNQFIPDQNGDYFYTGHNRESIGKLFDTWDTNNVFAADIKKIAAAQYNKELDAIKTMNDDELMAFIQANKNSSQYSDVFYYSREALIRSAISKYFNIPDGLISPDCLDKQSDVNNYMIEKIKQNTI